MHGARHGTYRRLTLARATTAGTVTAAERVMAAILTVCCVSARMAGERWGEPSCWLGWLEVLRGSYPFLKAQISK